MAGKPPVYNYEVTYYHDGYRAKFTGPVTTYTMTHLAPLINYEVRARARNSRRLGTGQRGGLRHTLL